MHRDFRGKRIAIIGGGRFCEQILRYIASDRFPGLRPQVLAVSDTDPDAPGLHAAQSLGIPTCQDYTDLFRIEGLQVLLELTYDPTLGDTVRSAMPGGLELIDHFEARYSWDLLQIEEIKQKVLSDLPQHWTNPQEAILLFESLVGRIGSIIERRYRRNREIELELFGKERALSQIIQGSTIPTFVIDQEHTVTHWNRAMEKLTGIAAERVVGTRGQWMPFYESERPSMADVILDQSDEKEIEKLYGGKWRKSALIEGAFEAEDFFPTLGSEGTWCWFTAAPILSPDGTIVGAIETLWDKTEDKRAEQERERHTRLMVETARALAKSEAAMKQIIQGSTIPTFVIDEQHTVTHWNRALEVLVGHSAEKIVGTKNQWTPFYPCQRPTMADVILNRAGEERIQELYGSQWRKSSLIEGAYEADGFFPNLGKEGKWLWFTSAPIHAPDGKIIGAIETLWDKTEDKKAEEEKERHTRQLSTLCNIYTALSASLDIDTALKMAVEELKRFSDAEGVCIYLKDENGLFRLRHGAGISEEDCEKVRVADDASFICQVARENQFTFFDERPEGSSDEIRFLEQQGVESLAYIPISSRKREAFGVIRIGSRIPKRFSHRQKDVFELIGNRIGVAIENAMLQERYIKSEEKYRTLFNSDPHPIFILDSRTFQILDTNERTQDTYGYGRKELLGVSFLSLGEKNDEEILHGLSTLSQDRSMLFAKKRHYRKDGRPFYVNINISHARYGESSVIIASTTDITENVEKETQLVQASKMTTLGQMAAGIAHEINQPLNVIQVCADYLKKMIERGQSISDDEMASLGTDIGSNVQRASGIIKHMRDFARQSEVTRSRICINDPIRDVFKVLGHQLKMHQVSLDLDLAPDLPPILGDHNRLEQVFINLVTNAVDAMDERGGEPKRLGIKSWAEKGRVRVSVSDTGTGMSEDVMAKIFEPFFTTKDVGKGTGLGVSISYGIVKDYDGSIDVQSRVGEGTTFELCFPAAK